MTSVIEQFGVFGVFLLMVPESACIPVPSEATLMFSGFAVHQGWMSFPLAVFAATAGNLVGSLLAYGLGASRLLYRLPFARSVLSRWDVLLERHGVRAVLIARLLPLARTFVSLPAGARRVPLIPFVEFTVIGSALWAAGFIGLGMILAHAWASLDSVLGRALLAIGLLTLAASALRGRRRPDRSGRYARASAEGAPQPRNAVPLRGDAGVWERGSNAAGSSEAGPYPEERAPRPGG